eukprot:1322662-Prymnesium_polylepis.1
MWAPGWWLRREEMADRPQRTNGVEPSRVRGRACSECSSPARARYGRGECARAAPRSVSPAHASERAPAPKAPLGRACAPAGYGRRRGRGSRASCPSPSWRCPRRPSPESLAPTMQPGSETGSGTLRDGSRPSCWAGGSRPQSL